MNHGECKTEGCRENIWRGYGTRCKDHVIEYMRKEQWDLLNKYDCAERDGPMFWLCRTCKKKKMDIDLTQSGQCGDCQSDKVRQELYYEGRLNITKAQEQRMLADGVLKPRIKN